MTVFKKLVGDTKQLCGIIQLILQPQTVIEAAAVIAEAVLESADKAAAEIILCIVAAAVCCFQNGGKKTGDGFPVLVKQCFVTHLRKTLENENLSDGKLDDNILIGNTAAALHQFVGKIMLCIHGAGNQYGDSLYICPVSQLRA